MRIQENILTRSLDVVEGAMSFSEISPEDEAPPKEWIRDYGGRKAETRFRLAKLSWGPRSSIPYGVALAEGLVKEIIKVQAGRTSEERDRSNHAFRDVQEVSPEPGETEQEFEEMIVDDGK